MEFPQIQPSLTLAPYVNYYWVCTADEDVSLEIMYPTGHVELCIDITQGRTVRHRKNEFRVTPGVEVLGHMTMPTHASVAKGTTLLIAKLRPFAASLFFPTEMSAFTNESVDLREVLRSDSEFFYEKLLKQANLSRQIFLLEAFLVERLIKTRKQFQTMNLVQKMCKEICLDDTRFSIGRLSSRFGYSERYLQKVFQNWVGLTPKGFHAVHRFNKSLAMLQSTAHSLMDVAYGCGYYDQAHFIKEFRGFTGITPSQVVLD